MADEKSSPKSPTSGRDDVADALKSTPLDCVGEPLRGYFLSAPQQLWGWLERRPTVVYDEAKGTLAYRLSEAMFASLLAAYVIGFFSLIAGLDDRAERHMAEHGHGTSPQAIDRATASGSPESPRAESGRVFFAQPFHPVFRRVLHVCNLVCVSIAFAFLTSALYLKYHMSILTMPSYELARVNREFLIAVAQGIGFGFAIAWPALLCLIVAAVLLVCQVVQFCEVRTLLTWLRTKPFAETIFKQQEQVEAALGSKAQRSVKKRKKRKVRPRTAIYSLLRDHALLDWLYPGMVPFVLSVVGLGIGCFITYVFWSGGYTPDTRTLLFALCNIGVAGCSVVMGCMLVGRGGVFFDGFDTQSASDQTYENTPKQTERYRNFGFDIRYTKLIQEATPPDSQ